MHTLAIIAPGAEDIARRVASELPDLTIAAVQAGDLAGAAAAVERADLLLAWRLPSELLRAATGLRWIQSFGAGVDHLVGVVAPGITITRVVDAFGPAMADFVVAHCYAVTVGVRRAQEQQRRKVWQCFEFPLLRELTAVVVGLGSIGREVCRLLRANGVRVLGVSRGGTPLAEAERTFAVDDLDLALPEAHFLILALPLTPASRGLIDARRLARLPRGAWLINVARGPLVVERDLLAALGDRTHPLAGAVLDVFDHEPLPADHPFWSLDNVAVTPHMSGPDDEVLIARQFVDNYRRFCSGQPMMGVVDRQRGY